MKHYFILGYGQDGHLISLTPDGFTDLSLALELLETINKQFKAFIATRLM